MRGLKLTLHERLVRYWQGKQQTSSRTIYYWCLGQRPASQRGRPAGASKRLGCRESGAGDWTHEVKPWEGRAWGVSPILQPCLQLVRKRSPMRSPQ